MADTEVASGFASGLASGHGLSSRFRIDEVIGMGGMGLVLGAHHVALDQRVALKVMLPEHRANRGLIRRFLREARAAARLKSPHVARVIDVAVLDDGAPYIVMEYLDGIDVASMLRRDGPMPLARAAAIVHQASQAIAEAHSLQIIHRDLKPSNLFVVRTTDDKLLVKVLDLGVCKVASTDDPRHTSSTATVGTPVYMAVEQMCSACDADARSDIWSLGVILYELVEGAVPFRGDTMEDLFARASVEPVPPMHASVAPGFRAIIERCLAKDPAARYQRAVELAAALAPFAEGIEPPPVVDAAEPRRTWRLPALGVTLAGAISSIALGAVAFDHATGMLSPTARIAPVVVPVPVSVPAGPSSAPVAPETAQAPEAARRAAVTAQVTAPVTAQETTQLNAPVNAPVNVPLTAHVAPETASTSASDGSTGHPAQSAPGARVRPKRPAQTKRSAGPPVQPAPGIPHVAAEPSARTTATIPRSQTARTRPVAVRRTPSGMVPPQGPALDKASLFRSASSTAKDPLATPD